MSDRREPTGADIVSLLQMSAPPAVLVELGLVEPRPPERGEPDQEASRLQVPAPAAAASLAEELDSVRLAAGGSRRETLWYASLAGEALFWATRRGALRRSTLPLLSRLSVPLDVLLALVRRIEQEEQGKRFDIEVPALEKQKHRSKVNQKNADTGHDDPEKGSRAKRAAMQAKWASGQWPSRDACAQDNCEGLGMKFRTARDALSGTPTPDPWPARPAGRPKRPAPQRR